MRASEFITTQLHEAPLQSYHTMGDFSAPGPFRDPDYKLVTHPAHIAKVEHFFEHTPYNFRIFVSNLPKLRSHRESGITAPQQIYELFPQQYADAILQNTENAITVIFLGNYGDDKVMMTPWMMAHRIGHAINASSRRVSDQWTVAERQFFSTINTALANMYSKTSTWPSTWSSSSARWDLRSEYNALFNAMGTMKSTRSNRIKRPYEFFYELFAQYIKTGSVKLNAFPISLGYGRKAWGRPTRYMSVRPEMRSELGLQMAADKLAEQLNTLFDSVLKDCVGKVYLM